MRSVVLCLALSLFAAGACARAGDRGAQEPIAPSAEQQAGVLGAVEKWRQAQEVRSLEVLAAVYATDESLVLVQQGVATRGWASVSVMLERKLAAATSVRVRLAEVVVAQAGAGGAVVNARMTRETSDGVSTLTEDGPLTLAMRLEGTSWRIVAQHYSYPVR